MSDFVIVPRGPFSFDRAADCVAHFPPLRHQPGLQSDGSLRLGFISDQDHRSVHVTLKPESYGGVLHGTVSGTDDIEGVRRQVARIFALDVDGTDFPRLARRDPKLAEVMKEHAGLRPVSFTSPYECACWAILSQRITTTQAANIVRELVRAHGENGVFPRPDRLLDVHEIPSVPAVKLERLHAIAVATLEGKLDANVLRKLPEEAALKRLHELPGIGDFWASMIWLRACGVHDRFPDEPISIAALTDLHGGKMPDVSVYEPFGMWIAFLLRVSRRSSAHPRAHHAASPRRRARRAA
jgi:DNA-3-methyladenine glycosylase II